MIHLPENLDEALQLLTETTSEEERAEFVKNRGEGYHFGAGMAIRNGWGLWDTGSSFHKWFKERGIWHADDMSGIIFTSFYRQLVGEPIDLEGQIQFYKDFWKKNLSGSV